MNCSICLCDSATVKCPVAPSKHGFCKGCFGEGIVGRCGSNHTSYWDKNGGKLACPICDGRFEERTVFENTNSAEWAIYIKAVCDYRVALEVKAMEERASRATNTTREEIEVKIHVDHIRENILTLKCPKCAAPFADFDGCLALACGSCGTGFCAVCVNTSSLPGETITTSAQAHAHVIRCKYNPAKPSYYATRDQFVKARNGRYKDLVNERVIGISDVKIRLGVSKTILKDLKDLGIDAKVVSNIIKKNGEHEPAVARPLVALRPAPAARRAAPVARRNPYVGGRGVPDLGGGAWEQHELGANLNVPAPQGAANGWGMPQGAWGPNPGAAPAGAVPAGGAPQPGDWGAPFGLQPEVPDGPPGGGVWGWQRDPQGFLERAEAAVRDGGVPAIQADIAERVLEADARWREAEARRRNVEARRMELQARLRREAEARQAEAEAIAMVADFIARERAAAAGGVVVEDAAEEGGGGGGGAANGGRAEPPVVGPFHFGRAPRGAVPFQANARPRQYCEGRGCYKIAEFTFPESEGHGKCFKCTKEILGMGKNGKRSGCVKAGAVAIDA